ncbi:MAG: hypothetical protein WDN00_14730 [Limisphaerales bacterium]
MPATAPAFTVRQAVQELLASTWSHRRERMETLPRLFFPHGPPASAPLCAGRCANQQCDIWQCFGANGFSGATIEKGSGPVKKWWGLLLPPSVPGALVNYAALLCGKVPVNLNYTLSAEALASCVKQCDIKTVLTSRAFLEK